MKSVQVRAVSQEPLFRQLLTRSLLALVIGAVLVTLCFFLVDRPVAFFVNEHELNHSEILRQLTYPPPILEKWTPLLLAGLAVRRARGPFRRWELTLFAVCVSLLLTEKFRDLLGFAFGRTWPGTWIHDNPSLLKDGVYGFNPFYHSDDRDKAEWYASFPSGHTARVVAMVSVVWIAYPWWRWACVLATLVIAVALIGMDYHFVGDVIGGGFVGGIVGAYTTRFCGLSATGEETPVADTSGSPT